MKDYKVKILSDGVSTVVRFNAISNESASKRAKVLAKDAPHTLAIKVNDVNKELGYFWMQLGGVRDENF